MTEMDDGERELRRLLVCLEKCLFKDSEYDAFLGSFGLEKLIALAEMLLKERMAARKQ